MMNKIYLLFALLLSACNIDTGPKPMVVDIFNTAQTDVSDRDDINFKLETAGTYKLVLQDKNTNQILSRDKFVGKVGMNTIKIYTKSLQTPYLYVLLEDGFGNIIKKTSITIK